MTQAALIVEVILDQGMNREKAWDILVSYCVGRRHGADRFHTADLAHALSWALNALDDCTKAQ